MSRGIFVTGTDTGVGKSVVAAGTLRWLRNQGIDAVPMKPVQTGGIQGGDRLIAPDLELCLSTSRIRTDGNEVQLMSPYVYEPACSPHLAGRMSQRYADPSKIKDCADKLLQNHQALVVEGAGGVMAPLNESVTMLALMKMLAFPVVLVSRFGLGTINHTLLSIQALRTFEVSIIGVVFNHAAQPRPENQPVEEDNPCAIAQFGNVRVLGKLRYLNNLSSKRKDIWSNFEEDMTGLKYILDELGI
ncbi:dethiobiotin synthase [Chloroflexota bacterium]